MRSHGVIAFVLVGFALGCYDKGNTVYLKALEKVGMEKRDVLVKRVKHTKKAQEEAQEQFRDALEEFQAMANYDGGELEKQYEKLRSEYEASADKAEEVHRRIKGIRRVSDKLFKEWRSELDEYTDQNLRRTSEQQLEETRRRSAELIATMDKAAATMDPVLQQLEERVLFLKHNLNAQALGSLQQSSETLQQDVTALISEMQKSIAEADRFIAEMNP
jgi:ElaB/YqjD/DUF883 family membrane-anchored ribosome-binding protein